MEQMMFKDFPEGSECPICKSCINDPCILVAIARTLKDGIAQAIPVHIHCIEERALFDDMAGVIYVRGLTNANTD